MPRMDVDIGRDTLVALAAIAWADGRINPSEASGIRSAAKQLGMADAELGAVEATLEHPVPLAEVETIRMNRLTRLFTYAAATWIAEVDGVVPPEEEAALTLLGDRLGLSSVARERARNAVLAVLKASGTAAGGFDVLQLKSRLSAGLSQISDE
jgi:uncharacterized membrane protein YebE (DUF533 family)